MAKQNINLKSPSNPNGDSIISAFGKIDQNFDELHGFVKGVTSTPGTYTKLVVDAHGRVTAGAPLIADDINAAMATKPADLRLSAPIIMNTKEVGATNGSTLTLLKMTDGANNHNVLHMYQLRHSAIGSGEGAMGWDTITTRIEVQSDYRGQGWIDFNPKGGAGGILLGACDALGTKQRIGTLLINSKGIKVTGSIIPGGDLLNDLGSETARFREIYAKDFKGNAASATRLSNPLILTIIGDMAGSVAFDGSSPANLHVSLPSIVAPGLYSRVMVDQTGRITDGGALAADDVVAALSKPGATMLYNRCVFGISDSGGTVIAGHGIINGIDKIVSVVGLCKQDDKLLPMTLVSIDEQNVEMTGVPNCPVKITIQYSDTPMEWIS